MKPDIDKIQKDFFKKSLSVGHHNAKYTWMQVMLAILSCVRSLESIEEGANSPSPQTIRDRLRLDGPWLEHFHESVWRLAEYSTRVYRRHKWFISIDETHVPFFGDRDKLNQQLVAMGFGKLVHGYRAKTPGATGSFCFLAVSLCCCRVRIPIAISMRAVGERYRPWLQPVLKRLLKLVPRAIVLADRGLGKAAWFYKMLNELNAGYVVRIPLRAKKLKDKVARGRTRFQYWMTDSKTNEKILLSVRVAKDKQNRMYILATNQYDKTPRQLLAIYLRRWDIENMFKDSDRVELPTSSRNPRMRLYSVVLSFFLFALWQFRKLDTSFRSSLRRYVKQCIKKLSKLLKCIITTFGDIIGDPP